MWNLLAEILLLICTAFVLGALAQRFKQSPILGYLMAGTIIGPLLFNSRAVFDVAELGVALLLFSIGLEFSFRRLKSMGTIALAGGSLQVVMTLGIFTGLLSVFMPVKSAVVLGAIAALSSTAVVLRVLVDRAEIDSVRGRNTLGILLFQDIAVVPLVILVSVLSNGNSGGPFLPLLLKTLGSAAGIAIVFYLLFYRVFPLMMSAAGIFANRELFVLLTIAAAIGSIWAAHYLNLSPALGAFLAGMLLGESPYATQIRADIGSIRTLFVTLFFTSVGMLADPRWFASHWPAVFLWLSVVLAVKTLIIYFICRSFRLEPRLALATGFTLAQIGEFAFVLANAAQQGRLISENIFALIVSVAILSLFIAPYMVSYAAPASEWILQKLLPSKHGERTDKDAPEETPSDRIGIVGFGPAGQQVATALLEQGITPFVIELNPKTAGIARKKNLTVFMGDAAQSDILAHARVDIATAMIVTLPDPRTTRMVIENIRLAATRTAIIARGRYNISLWELEKAGADHVVDEENVVGISLARKVCEVLSRQPGLALACGLAGESSQSTTMSSGI